VEIEVAGQPCCAVKSVQRPVLGLSHQRIQQLVAGARPVRPTTPDPIGEAVESLARSVREYFPGGSKEDLGAIAVTIALALAVVWMQSR